MGRIDKVGCELEGGWNNLFPDEDPTEIYADHSVHLAGFKHLGEIASPPSSLEEVLKWVDSHYPNGMDSTCGMHVHLSLKEEKDYLSLCRTPHFFMKFLKWGETFMKKIEGETDKKLFYDRISGRNRFCALRFIPERQLAIFRKGGGNDVERNPRYAMLNFSKNVHGTFENRVFPLFQKKQNALLGIETYVETVEEFLSSFKDERKKVRVVL